MPSAAQVTYEQVVGYFSRPKATYGQNTESGTCQYLSPEGNKCAVGCLIPDDLYHAVGKDTIEDASYETLIRLVENAADKRSGWRAEAARELYAILDDDDEKRRFLSFAQRAHDHCARDDRPIQDFVAVLHGYAAAQGWMGSRFV